MIMGLAHYKPEKPSFRAINPGSTVTCQRNGDSLFLSNAMWIEPLGGWELVPVLLFQHEHFCLLFLTWSQHFENHQAYTGLLNLVPILSFNDLSSWSVMFLRCFSLLPLLLLWSQFLIVSYFLTHKYFNPFLKDKALKNKKLIITQWLHLRKLTTITPRNECSGRV